MREVGGEHRVLIADDSLFMRKVLTKIVESIPEVKVIGESSSGKEALINYIKYRPDVVILDVNMPELDGLSVTEEIMKKDPHAKVVIISAVGEREDILKRAKVIGVSAVLSKPFKSEEVIEVIKNLLQVKHPCMR